LEDKCKHLTDICNVAISNLDDQIKNYEKSAASKKLSMLQMYFDSLPKKHPEYISFATIINSKWSNATYAAEDAQREIDLAVEKSDDEVDTILQYDVGYQKMMLDEYKLTHDLKAAIAMKDRLARVDEEVRRTETAYEAEHKEDAQVTQAYIVICRTAEEEQQLKEFCESHGLECQWRGTV
jgi:hypothetical protein